MGKYEGASQVALKPRSTDQVSAILSHCNERRLAVVPQARSVLPGKPACWTLWLLPNAVPTAETAWESTNLAAPQPSAAAPAA